MFKGYWRTQRVSVYVGYIYQYSLFKYNNNPDIQHIFNEK